MIAWHVSIDAVGGAHRLIRLDDMPSEPEPMGETDVIAALAARGALVSACSWVARSARVYWSPPWRGRVAVATLRVTGTDPGVEDGVELSVLAYVGHDGVIVECGDHALSLVVAGVDDEAEVEVSAWLI